MNWVFETYSNVYQTAMMQDQRKVSAPRAKSRSFLSRLFNRG
jgi:hypothetical protein